MPDVVNGVVLESAVAVLCGGVDQNGTPLVIFPTDSADLLDIYAASKLLGLLKEYVHLAGGKVAMVADLKHGWSGDCISKLTTLLETLQTHIKDCITVAYFVKPSARTKKLTLHRQLSPLQTAGRLMSYKVVRVETFEELNSYIDKSQLTNDYGGTRQYIHVTWVDFYKNYICVLKRADKLKTELPAISEEIKNMERELPEADGDFVVHVEQIKTNHETILRRHCARETVNRCHKTLEILDHPETDETLARIDSTLLVNTTTKLRTLCHDIEHSIETLEEYIAKKELSHDLNEKLDECRRNSKEVIETIILMTHRLTGLPRQGRTAIEAQEYRNEFIEEVLVPSKDIVECSTSILQDLTTDKNTTQTSYKTSFEIARQLTEAMQPFTAQINKLNESYTRIHLFYVIYNKVVRWKEKASKFIGDSLVPLDYASLFAQCHESSTDINIQLKQSPHGDSCCNQIRTDEENGNKKSELSINGIIVKAPSNWDEQLDYFYNKHPPPRRKHLRLITKSVSDFIDKPQLVEAETLSERTMFILAFLAKSSFKGEDIVRILQWRERNHTPHEEKPDVLLEITLV